LKSKEGEAVKFNAKVLELCNFLKTTMEDTNPDDPIELDISMKILNKIKEFFENYGYKPIKQIAKPLKSSNFEEVADSWSTNFFQALSDQDIADLMMGASYLQCSSLFDYCCAFIACQFRDLTIEELKQKYGVAEELTPELEEQIKKEHAFLFQGIAPSLE